MEWNENCILLDLVKTNKLNYGKDFQAKYIVVCSTCIS